MEFGHVTRSLINAFGHVLKRVTDGVPADTEPSPLERPLSDGAEFSGDYNFRTGKMDCGTDPSGWYEDDL